MTQIKFLSGTVTWSPFALKVASLLKESHMSRSSSRASEDCSHGRNQIFEAAVKKSEISTDQPLVEKFDGDSFHLWKLKLRMLLLQKDLWTVVSGVETKPNSIASPSTIKDWERRDGKALATISLHLSDSQLVHVNNVATSKEAWDELMTLYGRKDALARLHLRNKLFNMKMKIGERVSDHVSRFRSLLDQLAIAGAPVLEEDSIMTLLSSLPPQSYEATSLLSLIASRQPAGLTLLQVIGHLLQEESRRNETRDFNLIDGHDEGKTNEDRNCTSADGKGNTRKEVNEE